MRGDHGTGEPFVPTVMTWMQRYGITFGPGASVAHDPKRGILIVRNSPDQLELTSVMLSSVAAESKSEAWKEARKADYRKKLDALVLPRLSFDRTNLWAAIDLLQLHSHLADGSGPVWERGLPIWMDWSFFTSANEDARDPFKHSPSKCHIRLCVRLSKKSAWKSAANSQWNREA